MLPCAACWPALPPAVQHECIPQAIPGVGVLCQAKSGMGKMAVFVLATLQQIELVNAQVGAGRGRLRWSRGLGPGAAGP